MLLGMTADDVIAGSIFIHHAKKHFLDTGTFLIDGIIQRINQVIHTFDDFLQIIAPKFGTFRINSYFCSRINNILTFYRYGNNKEKNP